MRFGSVLLAFAAGTAQAASSWSFDAGSLSITSKTGGDGVKERLRPQTPLAKPIALGSTDSVTISLTAKDNGKAKQPHQAFVVLKEESGLETPFPFKVKESGKATVSIAQKDMPVQFLVSPKPIKASVVIASFGSSQGLNKPMFEMEIKLDPSQPLPSYERPLRYGKKPEIQHIFGTDPRSPPKVVSLLFGLAVAATVPALLVGVSALLLFHLGHFGIKTACSFALMQVDGQWLHLGANVDHFCKAIGASPLSHVTFLGSIVAMEWVFFMYYTTWNLFQTLPIIGIVAAVTVLSGRKALGEVQNRRLCGER